MSRVFGANMKNHRSSLLKLVIGLGLLAFLYTKLPDREQLWEMIEAGQLPMFEDLAPIEQMDAETIELFAAIRQNARKVKDFATADAIRDDLKRRGVQLEDTPQGFRWVLG